MVNTSAEGAKIRIHFGYRHVDKPWGGANNFIRALHGSLTQNGHFAITKSIEDSCDILFMNQLGKGPAVPGKPWQLRYIERLLRGGSARKLVVRAVNLNAHAFRMGIRNFLFGRLADRDTVALLNRADLVIFQSEYQRSFFVDAGYRGQRDVVIHNGADKRFWIAEPACPSATGTLRLVSSTASPRQSKHHDIIACISALPDVEVRHLGAWPKHVDPCRVRLLGTRTSEEMVTFFGDAHYFLHPAVKDPCPNAVFEAICAGLPVIYNPGPGSSHEIVGACGFALDKDDLHRTVEQARRSLTQLRQAVLKNRQAYRIEHAAARYVEFFEQIV